MTLTRAGASARTYSSFQMTCWDMGAPRPPYSTGQPTQVQPSSPSLRSQASAEVPALVLQSGPAQAPGFGELPGEVGLEPAARLGAEGGVLGAVVEVHGWVSVQAPWQERF